MLGCKGYSAPDEKIVSEKNMFRAVMSKKRGCKITDLIKCLPFQNLCNTFCGNTLVYHNYKKHYYLQFNSGYIKVITDDNIIIGFML